MLDIGTDLTPWLLFLGLVAALLTIDLGIFHRTAHAVTRREALAWSVAWIGLAIVFNVGVYVFQGTEQGIEWTTGYLIEKSLAIDNVFVFLLIFSSFMVPPMYQHRVLFWGILGAIIFRAALIGFAGFLITSLHWVIYLFGAFLIFTGLKFLRDEDEDRDLQRSRVVRFAQRTMPVTVNYEGQKFFTRRSGVLYMTPLFLVLLLVEVSDIVFAVDSIPAIYAVTDDPFIVFTSNILAILGLRSLYFVLAGYLEGMRFLKPALAAILIFVGTKMLVVDVFHLPPLVSLAVIATILTVAIVASLIFRKEEPEHEVTATPAPPEPAAGGN